MQPRLTAFEIAYTRRVNTIGLLFLAVHLPVLCAVSLVLHGSPWMTAGIMLLLLAGPGAILLHDQASAIGTLAIAMAAMGAAALTINVCNGLIEAHFEIFVLLALLALYGRVAPLVAAGATICLHHLIFWVWLPSSVFNYKASLAIVCLHAFFVILEVVPICWIARQFGNSIKAQGIVAASLAAAAEEITTTASEVAASSQSLAQGASEQASAIEKISDTTFEINSMASRNTFNSQSTVARVSEADTLMNETGRSLDEMVEAMRGINESSEQISRIIKTIDQIAFQTHILALNAAVEAARAGSAGSGFAVVADEVRDLARRSAEAAHETASLIEVSITRSRAGMVKVNDVATAIRAMSESSSSIKKLMEQIDVGSREQSRGIALLSASMQQMDSVTSTNAATATETAAASQSLTAQSRNLRQIVKELNSLNGGSLVRAS